MSCKRWQLESMGFKKRNVEEIRSLLHKTIDFNDDNVKMNVMIQQWSATAKIIVTKDYWYCLTDEYIDKHTLNYILMIYEKCKRCKSLNYFKE